MAKLTLYRIILGFHNPGKDTFWKLGKGENAGDQHFPCYIPVEDSTNYGIIYDKWASGQVPSSSLSGTELCHLMSDWHETWHCVFVAKIQSEVYKNHHSTSCSLWVITLWWSLFVKNKSRMGKAITWHRHIWHTSSDGSHHIPWL